MTTRKRREYLKLLDAAKVAAETAIDSYNSVWHQYRNQAAIILMANAWELLAKAVLVLHKKSIKRDKKEETISGEIAVHRLVTFGFLESNKTKTIQQVISLRNAACHHILPDVAAEVMQHLLYYSCKFFRETATKFFPKQSKGMKNTYLSISFINITTYADKVLRSISKVRKSANDKHMVWLLERGVNFDGSGYITESQFENKYRGKGKVLPRLGLSSFIKNTDMVKILPIEAPKNYTADVVLRKGSKSDSSLPIIVKKTDIENDFPYMTKEMGDRVKKSLHWMKGVISFFRFKGDPRYHQGVRSSKTTVVHRYSESALQIILQKLSKEPDFNPHHS